MCYLSAASKFQTRNISLPSSLKCGHVVFAQNLHKHQVAARVVSMVGNELMVELCELALFLQVVAQVTCLGVVRAFVIAIELVVGRTCQLFKRWHRAGFDRTLQPGQPPIRAADDVTVALAGLFVERTETFVEPGRAFWEICSN